MKRRNENETRKKEEKIERKKGTEDGEERKEKKGEERKGKKESEVVYFVVVGDELKNFWERKKSNFNLFSFFSFFDHVVWASQACPSCLLLLFCFVFLLLLPFPPFSSHLFLSISQKKITFLFQNLYISESQSEDKHGQTS